MAKETVVVVIVVVGLIIGIGMADAIGVARFRGKLGRSKFSSRCFVLKCKNCHNWADAFQSCKL